MYIFLLHLSTFSVHLCPYKKGIQIMEQFVELNHHDHTLRGVLHIPDNQTKQLPFVILLHGFQDDRNEINFVHTELSRRLCELGIASARFDFYGSGESDGTFEDITISSEIEDTKAILDCIKNLDFVDTNKIALHGTSLGGCVATMVAGQCHEDICALSTWCCATDLVYNLQSSMTLCGQDVSSIVTDGYADIEGLRLSEAFYQDALTLDPYKDAKEFDKHVNLIHGDLDTTASCQNSIDLKEIFGERANLLIVEGAEHRFKSIEYREARMKSAIDFFVKELKGE